MNTVTVVKDIDGFKKEIRDLGLWTWDKDKWTWDELDSFVDMATDPDNKAQIDRMKEDILYKSPSQDDLAKEQKYQAEHATEKVMVPKNSHYKGKILTADTLISKEDLKFVVYPHFADVAPPTRK